MSGVLKAAATVVGAIAGAVAGAIVAGPVGAIIGAGIGAGLGAAGGEALFRTPEPSTGGQQTSWKADPYAGIPYVMGRTLVSGNIVARLPRGANNEFQGFCTVLSLGPITGYEAGFMNKTTMTWMVRDPLNSVGMAEASNAYRGYVWEQRTLGLCPESYAPGWSDGFAGWNNDNKLSGLAAVFNIFCYNSKAKDTLTSEPLPAWIVNGVKVYDPRLDSTYPGGSGSCRALNESTYVYSEDPHLHALTWCLGRWQNGKRRAGIGAPISSIDFASFVEGANLNDARGWKLGGQVYTRPDSRWNSLTAMLQAGGAKPVLIGGRIACVNRAPRVSLATITMADIVGEATLSTTQARRSRLNGIIPQYRSEEHDWEMVPAKLVQVADYVTLDGDERIKEIPYPLVQDKDQVAQLAAYDICDARELGPINAPLKPIWLNYRIGDCVTFAPESGFSVKTIITGRALDPQTCAATLTLQGETDGKHAFCLGQTGVAPAVATYSYDNDYPVPLGDWSVAGTSLTTSAGASIPALVITGAAGSNTVELIGFDYRLYSPGQALEDGWLGASFEPPTTVRKEITSVTPTTAYEVSVRYRVRGVLGGRVVFGPVTTGAGFTGDLDATNGAPSGTPVGNTTADNVANTVTNTVPTIAAALAAAQSQITTVESDVAAAASTANSAAATASAAASGLVAEITRATGAEGTLSSQIYSLGTSVSGLSSSLSAEIIARTDGQSALAASITSLTSTVNSNTASISSQAGTLATLTSSVAGIDQRLTAGSPNLAKNGSAEYGMAYWGSRSGTWVQVVDVWGSRFYATINATGTWYFDSDPIPVIAEATYTATMDAEAANSSGSDRWARVELLWYSNANGTDGYISASFGPTLNQPSFFNGAANRQALKLTQAAPAGAVACRVRCVVGGTNVVFGSVRQVKFEQGSVATAYSAEASLREQWVVQQDADASLSASITSLTSSFGSLSSTVSSNYTTLSNAISTNASAISTVQAQANGLTSTVSTQASAIADLQGRTGAYWSVTAVSGGGRASITLFSTTSYSGFDIEGDVRINGSLLVSGSVTADRVASNGITQVQQAYNGSSFSGTNMVDTGTTDPTTGDTIYTPDYWDVITLTVNMDYAGDIVAMVAAKQWYYSGGRDWRAQITIDGTEVFYTEGGNGAISDSIALSGKLSVGAGSHTVKFRWRSADSTLAMLAGKASLVTVRRYV